MLKTAANPSGLPMEAFDQIRIGVLADRSQAGRQGLAGPAGLILAPRVQAGFKGIIDCIKAFFKTDFTEDLKKFDVPTLIIHGDDDQIVPTRKGASPTGARQFSSRRCAGSGLDDVRDRDRLRALPCFH
jgi:non-heme chloroperoxidase